MYHYGDSLRLYVIWSWKSFTEAEYAWAAIGLFAICWFLCSRKSQ